MSNNAVYKNENSTDFVTGQELYAALPNATDAFEVTYTNTEDYEAFYNEVYEARNIGKAVPYRYGSYQIFQADRTQQQYNIIQFQNVTSQDVTGLYAQYIY
jgi:hypothetical protein